MLINILKSKIHNAIVTDAQIHYTGSITIDSGLMEKAGLIPFEKVMIVSLDSGQRLETYVIEGRNNTGEVCINGAAAKKIFKGERIIIMAFALIEEAMAHMHKPLIIIVDGKNRIIESMQNPGKDKEC